MDLFEDNDNVPTLDDDDLDPEWVNDGANAQIRWYECPCDRCQECDDEWTNADLGDDPDGDCDLW